MEVETRTQTADRLTYEAILSALFENYESIYVIDVESSAYQCYHESQSYRELQLESRGDDFFAALTDSIAKTIHPKDQKYVAKLLRREVMLAGLAREKYYSFVYRLMVDGQPLYHKIRATMESVAGRPHILFGVRNIDETIRNDIAHHEELASIYQKEQNHMEAILGSAAGYLEANLTRNTVLEISPIHTQPGSTQVPTLPDHAEALTYDQYEQWLCEHFVVAEQARYAEVSNCAYLISCFARGERRASVSFSSRTANGAAQPCRKVYYLYQDKISGDIMSFDVIYDLTEQQRKEAELKALEAELQMSRIHNFTSQMQPHFLYNALASIQEIILDDPQYASDLLGDFTIYLRSCIRAMSSDVPIPFSQELDNVKAYVNIEQMRFGEKLKVRYEIDTADFSIIPLTIQPLVENAIRHGIYQRGPAGGVVTLRTREDDRAWIVQVQDDGVGFHVSGLRQEVERGTRDSTGLKNIMFRLEKVMQAQVTISSTEGEGTLVTVTIPKAGDV
ncbi:MAG: histidine kinase [Oscillospiraceae bacterium]|nr:histidine kinase [Oscillospiraceae bacterium]